MADLGQDETAEPEPSDRDLTEDGTGRLGLAFNNPYLQRVYVDAYRLCRNSYVAHAALFHPSPDQFPSI